MQTLTEIYSYPIKSGKAINQPAAQVNEKGLLLDRRYMLVDEKGSCITGCTYPQLTQIEVQLSKKSLIISAPNMPALTINPDNFSKEMQAANICSDQVQVQHCHAHYDQWFSRYLQTRCRFVFCSSKTRRFVKKQSRQVSFAEGYPLLLINQTSLDQLNARLEKPVSALHFRPNLLVKGDFPFVEDCWSRIQIGEVEFSVSKPCSRCSFINIDPKTGNCDANEPLRTLSKFRYDRGNINFGQNLIPLNSGLIRAGDEVQVLSTQAAPLYSAQQDQPLSKHKKIEIHYQATGITAGGDTQQLLLEQAAQAGIAIPYSCRGGKCGCCKVKLLEGKVNTLNDQGLNDLEKEQGYVLACSCIPLSDITICY